MQAPDLAGLSGVEVARRGPLIDRNCVVAQRRPIGATLPGNAHSTEVPVCPLRIPVAPGATSRWAPSPLAGEDIIAPNRAYPLYLDDNDALQLCAQILERVLFAAPLPYRMNGNPGLSPEEWPLPAPAPCPTWGY